MPKSSIPLAFALLSTLLAHIYGLNPVERSVSPSGQFVIYGGDAAWRGATSTLAERTKTNLLAVLRQRDQWKIAAVVNLQARAANVPEIPDIALRISQTDGGLKLQLDLTISQEMKAEAVEREILGLILLDMIYRNQSRIAPVEFYAQPPDWLIEGLLMLAPDRDRNSLARALLASDQLISLEEFLKQRRELLDPAGRSLYRAYSFVLVELLAAHPMQLAHYIDTLASSSNDTFADLRKSFPQLAGSEFESVWKSQIVALKDSSERELLSFSQSDDKFGVLLRKKFTAANGREESLSFEDLSRNNPTLRQRLELKSFSRALLVLATRVNPALHPIVQDYQQLADQLALGKNHGVANKLASLQTLRKKLSARMTEIDDYMNWYEATQLRTQSGLFENEASVKSMGFRRRDAFTVYLDAMESQF